MFVRRIQATRVIYYSRNHSCCKYRGSTHRCKLDWIRLLPIHVHNENICTHVVLIDVSAAMVQGVSAVCAQCEECRVLSCVVQIVSHAARLSAACRSSM